MTKSIIKTQVAQYNNSLQDRKYDLSAFSHARVGLGHTGGHLPLQHWLNFQAGFAQAKDAVRSEYNTSDIHALCKKLNLTSLDVYSQADDTNTFLLRPDKGRLLSGISQEMLENYTKQHTHDIHRDLLIVISGGLSPIAIAHQINGFLTAFTAEINKHQWTLAPILINPRGRVALGDQINTYFKAKVVIMLIGERPGLSTPDSMGIYITHNAKPGTTDEQRQCISNIHRRGLLHEEAASQLYAMINELVYSGLGDSHTLVL
jgi:ethanolamine ammonia-lyase small subunit